MCPPATGTLPPPPSTGTPREIPNLVPKDPISQAAYTHAAQHLHWTILNHSFRVYLYARAINDRGNSSSPEKLALLFAACILHDLGTASAHDGPLRFEVEGSDAAKKLLMDLGVEERLAHEVWVAIALHTSYQIAERISPLARLVRLGVAIDFKRPDEMTLTNDAEIKKFEDLFPRGKIEKVLGDAVAEQGLRQPSKAPRSTWPGGLVEWARANGGWAGEGVNGAF